MFKESQARTPAPEMVSEIVEDLQDIAAIKIIVHPANWNWRQQQSEPEQQVSALESGLTQFQRPEVEVSRKDVVANFQSVLGEIRTAFEPHIPRTLMSIESSVVLQTGDTAWLPTMNYHPEGVELGSPEGLTRVVRLLSLISRWETSIVETDRYWHAYAHGLMTEPEFHRWLSLHSNATALVSPRYIGQSLADGYTPTRLVGADPTGSEIKVKQPEEIGVISPEAGAERFWQHRTIAQTIDVATISQTLKKPVKMIP
jgi:hypothetical protein